MENTTKTENQLDNVTVGFGVSAVIVIIFNTALTITKELHPQLLAFMKSISILGVKHHWLVHGLTITILFFLLGWLFSNIRSLKNVTGRLLFWSLLWATILGALAIFAFFLFELFH